MAKSGQHMSTASLDNLLHIKRMPPYANGVFRLVSKNNATQEIMTGSWFGTNLRHLKQRCDMFGSRNPHIDCWIEWMDRDGHIWSVEVIDD